MSGGRSRCRVGIVIAVAVVFVAGTAVGVAAWMNRAPEAPVSKTAGVVIPHPLTPAQQLVVAAGDPLACAVTFAGDGIALDPMLQRQDALYEGLPIPTRDGQVFAGWYATAADATAFSTAARVNGADPVTCVDQEVELFGAWKTPEDNVAEDARIPILMYHQFSEKPEGEKGWLRGNYAFIGDFDAQMAHIAGTGFYLPTWDELSAFIEGRLFLPARSVIITDDDADQSWFDLAVPVIEKYGLLSTSFMITAYRQDPPPSIYVQRRSHTHDMHQAGDDSRGRMVNWAADQISADLKASADVLGVRQIVAYPFGHYNDTAKQGVAQAGYEMARTIEPGTVRIGADKLALPVVRIDYGMTADALTALIG